jgi:hypothetical protein
MYSERQKRDASLGVLEKLRNKGMPSRPEEDMESMFEVAVSGEEEEGKEKEKGKKKLPDIELEDDTALPPQPVLASPASKKGPNLNPGKTKEFMKAFKGMR